MKGICNFFPQRNKGLFAKFLFSIFVCLICSSSCTLWPVLTVTAVNKPKDSDSSSNLLLMLLVGASSSEAGNATSANGSGAQTSTCGASGCTIFLSSGINGNLGGITGADSHCVTDAVAQSAPGNTASYKALIMTDNGSRNLTSSWVLYPNTVYRSMNNSNLVITTTDANGQFQFPLSAEITGAGGNAVYTGINTTGPSWVPKTGVNCLNWTDNTNLVSGWIGVSNTPNQELDSGASFTCDQFLVLYCVQR
ncbi:DUF1554 domain-containing protein [Leptospira stimsonii]|uniref:DUF1554 domain-containing protein n=2 Tax=Leptospira stimsonii TaxID=2202203 RepID=A0ABY2MUL7_9LEPT|nr:DUF1554 domain-containing protein [Leptospira stimsonii]TGM08272.1 DUF1554 domain-containing protein [Leptospira stimsonii]